MFSSMGNRVRSWLAGAAAGAVAGIIVSLCLCGGAQAATPRLLTGELVDGHHNALNAVSCASPSRCVTGGADLIVQDHGVRSDLSSQLSSDTAQINSISCVADTTFCVIVDDSGGAYTLSGSTLSSRAVVAPSSVQQPNGFNAVSCSSTSFCMAIDQLGNAYEYNGTTWGPPSQLVALSQASSAPRVSCASSQFCVAALPAGNGDEDYRVWSGTAWGTPHLLESGESESGLSCTTPSFCVAADNAGYALKFNGSAWTPTPAPLVTGNPTDAQLQVSCAASFCLAASSQNSEVFTTSDGTDWTAATNLELATGTAAGGSASCATASMCAIVDDGGHGYTYAPPDTLATRPSLAGSATVGSKIALTRGTASSGDQSIVDRFQRCLNVCTTLSGTSYTTTAADVGARFQDVESTGVGLDIGGPFASNTIGPITAASKGNPGGGAPGGGPPGAGNPGGHAKNAKIGPAKVSGDTARLTVNCPPASSAKCAVKAALVVTETVSRHHVTATSVAATGSHKPHTRKVTLGRAATSVKPGHHAQLKISLNHTGRRLLRAHHRLKAKLTITEHRTSVATRHVTFHAAKRHRK
jgi:hypothetical protein